MMPNLSEIYDLSFYEEWGIKNEPYVQSAQIITNILYDQLKPKRLVDIGCGSGVYSHFFQKKGVEVLSIDGVKPPKECSFSVSIEDYDLTVPIKMRWKKFDMALCLEVAEHIPAEFSKNFLKNLTQFSDTLILSAAPPHQGGHHHVNEQPKRYWVNKLAQLGFVYSRKRTGQLVEQFKKRNLPFKWMGEHISFYEKMNPETPLRQDLPFSVRL